MSLQKIKIDHKTLQQELLEHLKIENNKRILFSGPFGTGKSTFLQEFSEINKDNYIFLKLFPVNYSVAPNEDVFELIKYDLLIELLGKYKTEIDLQKEDFSILLSAQYFAGNRLNYVSIFNSLISLSEKIGKPVAEMIKTLQQTNKEFKDFRKEVEVDEEKMIQDYLARVESKTGNAQEFDAVSQLINDLIDRIKSKRVEKNPEIQSVLIVDDLDRLDPDHTFRLFNVFSAHYDKITDKNKFGFDKVIFVCDLENIRAIFHHKYGTAVNFNGYIDKFYSLTVFDFDNRRFIREKLGEILFNMPINFAQYSQYNLKSSRDNFFIAIEWIIISLIEAKQINLRMLIQYAPFIPSQNEIIVGEHRKKTFAVWYELLMLFAIIKNFFGSNILLKRQFQLLVSLTNKDAFHILSHTPDEDTLRRIIESYCLPFLIPDGKGFANSGMRPKELAYSIQVPELDVFFHYNYSNDRGSTPYITKVTASQNLNDNETKINLYELLLIVFENCEKRGFLQ